MCEVLIFIINKLLLKHTNSIIRTKYNEIQHQKNNFAKLCARSKPPWHTAKKNCFLHKPHLINSIFYLDFFLFLTTKTTITAITNNTATIISTMKVLLAVCELVTAVAFV